MAGMVYRIMFKCFNIKERTCMVNPPNGQCYVKENAYQNALAAAALCKETEDRMILMEPKRKMKMQKV